MAKPGSILPKDLATDKLKGKFIPVGRTLPREIVKWIQGLDLSYSVKDPKRDLSNGFLVAEIFSRFYAGRVQMHSFDNSHNLSRRKNNWEQLELFFKKNDIPFGSDQFNKIVEDYDWDQLYNFVTNVYMFLTQRKVMNPPLATFVNSKEYYQSSITEGGTQTFLLKDKGLEKLDNLKADDGKLQNDVDLKDHNSEKQAQLSVSSKRTNFLRVPSKPISQNVENLHYQIDVKNYQIRPLQGSVMKIKEQQQQHLQQSGANDESHQYPSQKFQAQTNGMQESFNQKSIQDTQTEKREGTAHKEKLEKTIYEVLNETLMMRMQLAQFTEDMKKFKAKNNTLVQSFIDQIEIFSDEFTGGFFQEIAQQKEAFITFIFKDTNDLWKFFNFCFQCLNNLSVDRESFKMCIDLVHQFGQKALQKDANKTRFIFTEFFLPQLCQLLKDCILFEKKEMIIQLIYSFCPPDPSVRHMVIGAVKEQIKQPDLFMQVLTILVKLETFYTDAHKQLFEDFLQNHFILYAPRHYAQIHLFSQSPALSSCSLAILTHIAEVQPSLVHTKLYNKVNQIAKNRWWQNRCLAIILFSALIKGVISSSQYQILIKAPQQGQKFFSMENDRLISDLKGQVQHFANGIVMASQPASSDMLLSTTLIYIVDLLGDSKILLDLFTKVMLEIGPDLRQWVLYGGLEDNDGQSDQDGQKQVQDNFMFVIPSDKSFKYKTNINSQVIQQFAPSILMGMVEKLKVVKPASLSTGQFQLIHYCFLYSDFKVMNMESCEQVGNVCKEYIYLGLSDSDICTEAAELVHKLLELQQKAEVSIGDQESLFVSSISLIIRSKSAQCLENLIKFLDQLIEESQQSGFENLKSFLKSIYTSLEEARPSPLQNTQIARCFERLSNEDVHFSPSNFKQNNMPTSQINEDMEISAVDKQQDEYMEEAEFGEQEEQEELEDDYQV